MRKNTENTFHAFFHFNSFNVFVFHMFHFYAFPKAFVVENNYKEKPKVVRIKNEMFLQTETESEGNLDKCDFQMN